MKTIYKFAVGIVITCSVVWSPEIYAHDYFGYGNAFGKHYTVRLTGAEIEQSPKWREGDNPPLSVKQALRAAEEVVRSMERRSKGWSEFWKRSDSKFVLETVGNDKWIWIVNVSWVPQRGSFTGEAPQLSLAVTMDGKVFEPSVIDLKILPPGSSSP